MDRYIALTHRMGEASILLRFKDVTSPDHYLTRREVNRLWRNDDIFCTTFSRALAEAPMEACFWETPPLSPDLLDLPFECVLTPASSLIRQVSNPRPFAAQLDAASDTSNAIAFDNLGGDASLIVPLNRSKQTNYVHLAAFLRTAEVDQIHEVWRMIGQTADLWLAQGRTFWISTSGLGVSWLHIRIDSKPKYYTYAPYRQI